MNSPIVIRLHFIHNALLPRKETISFHLVYSTQIRLVFVRPWAFNASVIFQYVKVVVLVGSAGAGDVEACEVEAGDDERGLP